MSITQIDTERKPELVVKLNKNTLMLGLKGRIATFTYPSGECSIHINNSTSAILVKLAGDLTELATELRKAEATPADVEALINDLEDNNEFTTNRH